jgi:ABC-2 type transport system ATP-binding protein
MEYAIDILDLTKKFRRVKRIPTDAGFGDAHWIMALGLKLKFLKAEEMVAVDHVNLKVRAGELFGLLGPNGAGKTTLIKCLSTLLIPNEGTALINGHDVVKEPDKVKRCINLVGSGNWVGFDWALSVRENLAFFANMYGLKPSVAKERVDEALKIVGLKDKEKETPSKISSGMRQKMIIAKGFIIRTPIFYMDEPTIGLDPISARDIRTYIKETLSDKLGETIVLTTHYMQEAEQLCDRIAIMDGGKIVACGSSQELKEMIGRQEVIEIETINIGAKLERDIRRIDLVDNVASHIDDGATSTGTIRVHTEDTEAVLPTILRSIEGNGGKVLHVNTSQPTLEDVFMKLTGKGLVE